MYETETCQEMQGMVYFCAGYQGDEAVHDTAIVKPTLKNPCWPGRRCKASMFLSQFVADVQPTSKRSGA